MRPIFRVLYRLYRMVTSVRDRLSRRFTRAGLAVAGSLFVVAMTGLDTDNTVAYQAFVLLLSLLLLAVLFSFYFRMRFSATRLLPRFGTVGRPFRYRVVVRNLTSKHQRGLTLLEHRFDLPPSFREWLAVQLADEKRFRSFRFNQQRRINPFKTVVPRPAAAPPLPPRQETEVAVELTPLRRGVLHFRGVTLARPDPLGLVHAFARTRVAQKAVILPKRYPLPPVALPGTQKYQEGGVALASDVGQSEEFVSLRDYRRGDPLRHIHWRSWAKTGKPIVKEFEDEFFVRHALVLDTFTEDPRSEVFEEAVSVAASFACTVLTQESLLDLLFVGPQAFSFTAGRGLAHTDQMLEILASVQPCAVKSIRALEDLVLDHAGAVSGCICVFLAWDEPRRTLLRKLASLGVPVLTLVVTEPGQGTTLAATPPPEKTGAFHVLEAGRIEEGLAKLG